MGYQEPQVNEDLQEPQDSRADLTRAKTAPQEAPATQENLAVAAVPGRKEFQVQVAIRWLAKTVREATAETTEFLVKWEPLVLKAKMVCTVYVESLEVEALLARRVCEVLLGIQE